MAPSFWWGAADLVRATRNGWIPTMIVQLLSLNKMMDIGRKHQGEKIKMVCEALKKRNHNLSNKHLKKQNTIHCALIRGAFFEDHKNLSWEIKN